MKKMLILGFLLAFLAVLTTCEGKPGLNDGHSDETVGVGKDISRLLLEAASQNRMSRVEELLEHVEEKDLNRVLADVLEWWHLYRYPHGEDFQLVRLLFQRGADPNAADADGDPIIFKVRTVEMLKVFGEDSRTNFKAKTSYGGTLLLGGIGKRNEEIVAYLLEKGADPNEPASPRYGEPVPPLHFAIQYDDDLDIVKLLINHPKIDLNLKNDQNMTPLEWARHLGKSETVKLLLEKMKNQ